MKGFRKYKILFWGIMICLALSGIFFVFSTSPATAAAGNYFATPSGSGTACSRAAPCSVQTAVSLAGNGDSIYLAAGTYLGAGSSLLVIPTSVQLLGGWDGSASGPIYRNPDTFPTILDGQNQRRVIFINQNTSPLIDGIHLINGNTGGDGGGIYANFASPFVSRCQIYNNVAGSSGGGIYFNNSPNAVVRFTSLKDNTANLFLGGGIYIRNGNNTLLFNNDVINNDSGTGGGGIFIDSSDNTTILSNQIYSNTTNTTGAGIFLAGSDDISANYNLVQWNTAATQGGGIHLNNSKNVSLVGNILKWNTSGTSGGGISIYAQSDNATLSENRITGNSAGADGGGLFFQDSAVASMANNLIAENNLVGIGGNGAGIYFNNTDASMLHTTIARNEGGNGQGILIQNNVTAWITNTILVSHTVGLEAGSGTVANLTQTLWGGGSWANIIDYQGPGPVNLIGSSFFSDPDFANPAALDYHIGNASGALNNAQPAGLVSDFDFQPRPYLTPDLGADEYWPPGQLALLFIPIVRNP